MGLSVASVEMTLFFGKSLFWQASGRRGRWGRGGCRLRCGTFGVVHAVADDELVGDLEAYVVGLDGDEAALGLVEAGGDL